MTGGGHALVTIVRPGLLGGTAIRSDRFDSDCSPEVTSSLSCQWTTVGGYRVDADSEVLLRADVDAAMTTLWVQFGFGTDANEDRSSSHSIK